MTPPEELFPFMLKNQEVIILAHKTDVVVTTLQTGITAAVVVGAVAVCVEKIRNRHHDT